MNPITSREAGLDPDRNRPFPHRMYPKNPVAQPTPTVGGTMSGITQLPISPVQDFSEYFKVVPEPIPVPELVGIDKVLSDRGNRYGKFTGHAKITQDIKSIMHNTKNWSILANDQKEALEMLAHKVGRILNGDPNYDDSWIDIGGYSKLVADRLTSGKEV